MKRVRVLAAAQIDGVQYRPNQVVDLPDAAAAQAVKDGIVDADKTAVEQGLKESGKPIAHKAPASEEKGDAK